VVERIAGHASPTLTHAASSRTDSGKGEAIVLFTTDGSLRREQLSSAAKQLGAPELAVPRDIRIVAEIPLLGSGKTDYLRLKQWAARSTDEAAVP
jgi:acyl-[acyl-carrier-protein]-phospholipid O-acyltransferase / long-chain-fatty-acid--[acyl-carrier-protein] ligase